MNQHLKRFLNKSTKQRQLNALNQVIEVIENKRKILDLSKDANLFFKYMTINNIYAKAKELHSSASGKK